MFLPSTYLFTFVCEEELRIAAREGTHVNRLKRNELIYGGNLLGDIFTISLGGLAQRAEIVRRQVFQWLDNGSEDPAVLYEMEAECGEII